jgi:cephalosporin hydroxylase
VRVVVDSDAQLLTITESEHERTLPLYSDEAFAVLSELWLRVGWNQKYTYTFTWLGRPIIQLPEDLLRLQEVIYRIKPDVVIETGVAHGGTCVFYSSIFETIGRGRVIGVDILIRPENRRFLEAHELARRITLIEGSSTDPEVVQRVRASISPGESVMVVLDSRHDKAHVRAELDAYSALVTPDSYIVATDGIMASVADAPRGRPEWLVDNPAVAAQEFARFHPEFVIEQPIWLFNESTLRLPVTHFPSAWLKRIRN